MTLYTPAASSIAPASIAWSIAKVVAVLLGQLHIIADRPAVEPFGLGNRPGALGERLGQVTTREGQDDAPG